MTRLLGLSSWSLAPCESIMDWEQQQACACHVPVVLLNQQLCRLQRRPCMTHCRSLVSCLHPCDPTPRTRKTSLPTCYLLACCTVFCLLLQCVHHSNTSISGSWLCGAQRSAAQSKTLLQQQPALSKHGLGARACMAGCTACAAVQLLLSATVTAAETYSMFALVLQCLRVSTQDRVDAAAFVPPPSFPAAALLYAEVQGLNERYDVSALTPSSPHPIVNSSTGLSEAAVASRLHTWTLSVQRMQQADAAVVADLSYSAALVAVQLHCLPW